MDDRGPSLVSNAASPSLEEDCLLSDLIWMLTEQEARRIASFFALN